MSKMNIIIADDPIVINLTKEGISLIEKILYPENPLPTRKTAEQKAAERKAKIDNLLHE